MATYDWIIEVLESGNTYRTDSALPRPNADIETKSISNIQVIKLADGTEAFLHPETKYVKDIINMFFSDTTTALRNQIQGYITNGDKLKITTHSGQVIYGYFIDLVRVWYVGRTDTYDISVQLKETLS